VIVGYGVSVPQGHLPVYSTDTEAEARQLLVAACGTTPNGDFFARELVADQSLENLAAFSDRLHAMHERMTSSD
jgi:hypothetical protein